jgi:hypothetical protein
LGIATPLSETFLDSATAEFPVDTLFYEADFTVRWLVLTEELCTVFFAPATPAVSGTLLFFTAPSRYNSPTSGLNDLERCSRKAALLPSCFLLLFFFLLDTIAGFFL